MTLVLPVEMRESTWYFLHYAFLGMSRKFEEENGALNSCVYSCFHSGNVPATSPQQMVMEHVLVEPLNSLV